ncbi:MAG: hypothetical protein KatS3mg109_0096 [Pirellulaceae bacterium]|nr:MAG: hypothetical protein KatS3mg109_0096 [Pirellulaceae bacterium]
MVVQAIVEPTVSSVAAMLRLRGVAVNRRTIQKRLREAEASGRTDCQIAGVRFVWRAYAGVQPVKVSVEAIVASLPDRRTVWRLAHEADRIRRNSCGEWVCCPHTHHWAGWRDRQAVDYHGLGAGDLVDRFGCMSMELWDGTYAHLWCFRGLSM